MHGMVAEGVFTTHAAVELARVHRVEMPITAQMDAILQSGKSPREAIHDLMTRSGKRETGLDRAEGLRVTSWTLSFLAKSPERHTPLDGTFVTVSGAGYQVNL